VRVLMNDFIGLGFPADTFWRVFWYFDGTPVQVKGFDRFPREGAMHGKTVVIDGQTLYSIGSPLLQEYFGGSSHEALLLGRAVPEAAADPLPKRGRA
jgi:hypothetical protein